MSGEPATTLVETTDTPAPADTALTGVETESEEQESTNPASEGDADKTGDGNEGDAAEKGGDTENSLETYADFELPEGLELDSTMLEKSVPLFKELGLDQEGAQKLVSLYAEQVQAGVQGQVEQFNQLKQDWLDAAKSDKEIGGDNFDQNIADAKIALNKFGTPELTKLLNEFGIGNNPEVIRFMARVGKLTKEDDPGNSGDSPSEKKDRVSTMYPNESKK